MQFSLLLFALLVAISCASKDSSFKKKSVRGNVEMDGDQVSANNAILLSKVDDSSPEENVEKLAIKFGEIDLKENFDAAYMEIIRTKNFNVMENLLMNYNDGLRFIKSTTVKDWNDVLSSNNFTIPSCPLNAAYRIA